jgi:hypothetical protein
MHSRSSNLQGALVYVLHKAYIVDPGFADMSDVPTKLEKSTVGIYSTAKAARAALRASMAEEPFQTDEQPRPKWSDFYTGPARSRRAILKRFLNGDAQVEDKFAFPWEEHWKPDGTGAFNVPDLHHVDDVDDEQSTSLREDADMCSEENDCSTSSSSDSGIWVTDGGDGGYCFEIEAVEIQ